VVVNEELWFTLFEIAKMGGCRETVKLSSTQLANRLGISQQTASRRLQELEREGLITREMTPKAQYIRVNGKGMDELLRVYLGLKEVFEEKPRHLRISGEVFSGMGEGKYYVSIEGYMKRFEEKLGFTPYPGTLNLRLRTYQDMQARRMLKAYPGIVIEEFEEGGRTFGRVKCFKAIVEGTEGSVLLINRTHYGEDVIEVIAPVYLREALSLKDGDVVTVDVVLES